MPYYGQWGGPADYAQQQQAQQQQMFQNLLRMMITAKQSQEERAIREREWWYKQKKDAYERQMAGEKMGLEKRGLDLTAQGQADMRKYRAETIAANKRTEEAEKVRHNDNLLLERERIKQAWERISIDRDTNARILSETDAKKAAAYRNGYNALIKDYQSKLADNVRNLDDNYASIRQEAAKGGTLPPDFEEQYDKIRQDTLTQLWQSFVSSAESLALQYDFPARQMPTRPVTARQQREASAKSLAETMGPFGGKGGGIPSGYVKIKEAPDGTAYRKPDGSIVVITPDGREIPVKK